MVKYGGGKVTILNAIVLGLIQGIAEVLPISSSGHMSVLGNLFDVVTVNDGHLLFDAMLKLGVLAAVLVVYWQEISDIFYEVIGLIGIGPQAEQRKQRYPYARLFVMLFVGTLPLLLALPVIKRIDMLYYRNVFIGAALILTGCMLYVSDRMTAGKKSEKSMTVFDALIVGLCQCVSVIPGISRTAATVTAGISTGLKPDFALKFSFLLSLPAMFGAVILRLIDAFDQGVDLHNVPAYLVGMLAAMLSGIGAIIFMRKLFEKGKFGGLAYYCWIFGVLSIILTMIF